METDNLDVLSDCVASLNSCNQSLSNSERSLERILYPDQQYHHNHRANNSRKDSAGNELKRVAKIINTKKVYRIYPISYINEQINDYNNIKNNRILSLIETVERLNELKAKEKENYMNFVELLQNRLEQFVKYNHLSLQEKEIAVTELLSLRNKEDKEEEKEEEDAEKQPKEVHRVSKEEQEQIDLLQEEIDTTRFQVSKLQLQQMMKS